MTIELHSIGTPNGWKVSIALEEMGLKYTDDHKIDFRKGEQMAESFLKISPNNKIPAIVDKDAMGGGEISIFESGAILLYLAEKTGKFLPKDVKGKYDCIQWLMWQMGGFGPMLGQCGHFHCFADKSRDLSYGQERYLTEAKRLFKVLDKQLEGKEYVCGDLSIADFAIWPWVYCVDKFYKLGEHVAEFKNVAKYNETMLKREGVQKGMKVQPM